MRCFLRTLKAELSKSRAKAIKTRVQGLSITLEARKGEDWTEGQFVSMELKQKISS